MLSKKKLPSLFLGRATCDITYYTRSFPLENEKMFADDLLVQPGGPALNAAITFSLLGGEGIVVSNFGESQLAKSIKNISVNKNLEIIDLQEEKEFDFPVSTIIVNKENGSRTIINSPQTKLENSDSDTGLLKKINPRLVLIDGYILEQKYELLKLWKENGVEIVLDGGSWKNDKHQYLHLVDIAICSNRFRFPGLDLDESISELHKLGIEKVAFTMEEKPVIVSIKGARTLIDVPQANAVDTLGAGDVFHGAFCYYYVTGKKFKETLKEAAVAASDSCRFAGTHTWINQRSNSKNI